MKPASFDPGPYPRTYRSPIVLRLALSFFALPFVLIPITGWGLGPACSNAWCSAPSGS